MISGAKLGATWFRSRYMFEKFYMFYNILCVFSFQAITPGVGRLVSWSVYFRALIWVGFVMLKYFFIYIYNNIIYIDKSSEQSGMHGVYKTDQLTNWPIGAAFSEGIRGFGRGEKMFGRKSRNVWEMGVVLMWMYSDPSLSLRMTRRGRVGWSVGQLVSFCACPYLVRCHDEMVCMFWLADIKEK